MAAAGRDVFVCHTLDELIRHYDQSGLLTMVVQEFIKWEQLRSLHVPWPGGQSCR